MAFLRKLFQFRAPPPQPTKQAEPLAFYLGGDGRVQAVKQSGFLSTSSIGRTGLGYAVANAEQYARAAIASVWANNCINLRADTMARFDWFVRNKRTKDKVEEHPFTEALYRSKQNIMRLMEKRILTYGEFFLKPLHNSYNRPTAFFALNNLDMDIDDSLGYVKEFRYTPQGARQQQTYYPRGIGHYLEQIVYIHNDNDFDDHRGLSRFESILLEIGIDVDISRTTANFYKNDARPGLLLIPEFDLTKEQAEEFMDYWNAQFKGSQNTGRTALAPRVIKEIREFQRPPSIDDVELRESTRREICAAFKVPLSMAGAWDDATYQSLPEQRKFFYEETMIPAADANAEDLTKNALPFFDDSDENEVAYDASAILALVENAAEKVDINVKKLTSGAYTINEFREFNGDDAIEGGDVYILQSGWITVRADELVTYEAPNTAPAPEPMQEVPAPDVPQLPAEVPTRSVKQILSAYAYIPLAHNIDVLRIQRKLKEQFTDSRIEWQIPATFHVTLCYVDKIADTGIDALAQALRLEQMELEGVFLDYFDTPDGKALHIRLENKSVLDDIQSAVYEVFYANGQGVSEYSTPQNYKPHITLAYLPVDIDVARKPISFHALADTIEVSRDNYDPVLKIHAPQTIKHNHEHNHDPVTFVPIETTEVKTVHAEAIAELRAWQKFHANGTATKRAFTAYMIRDDIADTIAANLATVGNDSEAIKAVFKAAEETIAVKQADVVRSNFETEMKTLIDLGRANSIKRIDFTNRLKTALYKYGVEGMIAGLADGGVIIENKADFSEEDAATFETLYAEQSRHAVSLSEQVYSGKLTDAQALLKPRQWWGGSGQPFYDAGLLSAARNGMVEFVGTIDGNSCATCKALVGQRHRRRMFAAYGFNPPYGSGIICSDGNLCKHRLVSVNSRARGSLSRAPRK